jgi:hypothetical protein
MKIKRGRPRRFRKDAFLEGIHAGKSRKEVCDELKVSYKTLEYHLRRDKNFGGKVRKAESLAPQSAEEKKRNAKFESHFLKKHGVSFSDFSYMIDSGEPDKWFNTSQYYLKMSEDFCLYLKDLALRNPKKRWPAIKEILHWHKWNPEKRDFFKMYFLMDNLTLEWDRYGFPNATEMKEYLRQIEMQYEEFRQEKPSVDKYLEALSPSEREALSSQIAKAYDHRK